jgi:hypothetical protein
VLGFFANLAVKPVADRYHEHREPLGARGASGASGDRRALA